MPNNNTNTNFRQLILLDNNVRLVGSDDILFSTQRIKNVPVQKWFPFIESIFNVLKDLTRNEGELIFSRVESPAEFLPGSYDFSFIKIELKGIEYIQWSIYDYTNVYAYLTKYQQLKNEKDIYRQKLEYHNERVTNIEDLLS